MSATDLSQTSMHDLFRREAEEQTELLSTGLLALERDPHARSQLDSCMRAAHSIKGAARIVGLEAGVRVAHALESCFVAAQRGALVLGKGQIDYLLRALDLLRRISKSPERDLALLEGDRGAEIGQCVVGLQRVLEGVQPDCETRPSELPTEPAAHSAIPAEDGPDRVLRVTADTLNRLLGLAGESLVESRRLQPFAQSLLRLKRFQYGVSTRLEKLQELLAGQQVTESALAELAGIRSHVQDCLRVVSERLTEFEIFDRRAITLSQRLYEEAVSCRMRPFRDGTRPFPRMVRDLARTLHKEVQLQVTGEDTQIDRDILERLDAPLGHLLRNAVDHGIERSETRRMAGKPPEGLVHLDARQSAGRLLVTVRDDGAGIDREPLRKRIAERGLASPDTLEKLSEAELFDFLLLPGFSLADTVTEVSGRGVGLDVVHELIKQLRGTLRISSEPGSGTQFQLQLPITLSVVRSLLVEVGGEPYALPLAGILRTLKLAPDAVAHLEGRPHFDLHGRRIGLVAAHQLLEYDKPAVTACELPVVVLGDEACAYGIIVDRLLGERELVVHLLDPRLGKIKDVSAASLMEDGSPVLILDLEDVKRSLEKLASSDTFSTHSQPPAPSSRGRRKRVLIVEDSLTVRELERKLLANMGYEVEVAVDGMDGWNALRTGEFDLVVTDIDMPRLDGIELLKLIRQDRRTSSLRVMIVSYKDRPEDRSRGLDAGADFYLAKGNFHDDSLLAAVTELIGGADA
jgi:two-component system sensor histidine kinase and response regulator WspE